MMKHLFFTCLCCLAAQFCFSQISVGGNIGLAFANQNYQNFPIEYGTAILPKLDLMVEAKFRRRFSAIFEVGCNLKGNTARNIEITDATGGTLAQKVKRREAFHYLEAAMLLKFKFLNKKWEVFSLAGPSIGYLADAKSKFIPGIPIEGGSKITDVPVDLNNFTRQDIGLNIGAGIARAVSKKGKIQLVARYQHGLTNLVKSPTATTEVYNRTTFLTAGYVHEI